MFIEFERKQKLVYVRIRLPMGVFPFAFDAGTEWAAHALYIILRKTFMERVQQVREEEYELGLKDARKRKAERRDWFSGWLERNQ